MIQSTTIAAVRARFLWAACMLAIPCISIAQANWTAASNGHVPPQAINGSATSAKPMQVCRAWYQNGVHPGKLIGRNCNIAWGDREITVASYEVLTGRAHDFGWVRGSNGSMPSNPVYGGQEPGRRLAVCRADYMGEMHPGKMVGNICQFGWGGRAVSLPIYQVLVPATKRPAAQNNTFPGIGGLPPMN